MLARLPEIAAEARAPIARRFLAAQGLADADGLAAEVLAVLDDPAFAAAFGPGSRAEVSIVGRLERPGHLPALVSGQIDRLLVTPHEVLIVDFKTGRPVARETEVPPLYASQMALYRAAARRIFPGRSVSCALVWTEGPQLLALSPGFLDAETIGIRARLDPGGGAS